MSAHRSPEASTSLTQRSDPPRGRFSCVVDEHPRFHLDALRWYAALSDVAGVSPDDLVVHSVGGSTSDILEFLRSEGVTVRGIDRFDDRSPHCNKISGALRLAEDDAPGLTVLCDTDVVVLEDPRRLDVPHDVVAGKPVDAPVPPLEVLLRIFAAAGLSAPPAVPLPWEPDQRTLSGNNNGGLYLVPSPLLRRVATAWAHWATWLLDQLELLENWAVYVDQVAMAMALTAENVASVPLDVRWNTPIHDPTRIPADPPEPAVIHYHQELDRLGQIRATGAPSIDRQIDVANTAIRRVWTKAAPESSYREWLSQSAPEQDRELMRIVDVVINALEPSSVLDVGANNGIGRNPTVQRYTTIAPSDDVRQTLAQELSQSDLVVCLDELTHDTDASRCVNLVELLWRATGRALVIRSYDGPVGNTPDKGNDSREALSDAMRRVAPDAEIYPVRVDANLSTFVVLRSPEDKHPRDFVATTLDPLILRHPDPLSLMTLRLHALRTTRFYPDHAPRLWEYPVVAELITEFLPPGSRLIDVGAGVTPLAPFLTSRGYVVDTVDPSPTIRRWPPQPDWNEWDFLDYGSVGLANRSWNCTLDELPRRPPSDGIYSISVIEHVTAAARRSMLGDISARTRPGGLVVLTIDLVPGTDKLWNLNLLVEVENPARHGTIHDVVLECAALGLELFRQEIVRDWGSSRVDIGLLALRRSAIPATGGWSGVGQRLISRVSRVRRPEWAKR